MADDTFSKLMKKSTEPSHAPLSPTPEVSIEKNVEAKKEQKGDGGVVKTTKKAIINEEIAVKKEGGKEPHKTISHPIQTSASTLASELASIIDSLIADTVIKYKDQKIKGTSYGEVSYIRMTKEEKQALKNLVHTYQMKDIKISENDIVRILTSFMLADMLARKHDSFIARLIASIYK